MTRSAPRVAAARALYYVVLAFNLAVTGGSVSRRSWRQDSSSTSLAVFMLLYVAGGPGSVRASARTGETSAMSVPISQMWTVASYVLGQRCAGGSATPWS